MANDKSTFVLDEKRKRILGLIEGIYININYLVSIDKGLAMKLKDIIEDDYSSELSLPSY